MSSFDGTVPEIPGISIDNFERVDKRAYFLSHCHRDHMQGLTSVKLKSYLEENDINIYTSDLSAGIIKRSSDFCDVKNHIKPLLLGKPTLIKLKRTEFHEELFIEVTPIPAGHCFGSVMFLFRTNSKTVLFTGDFRIDVNDVCKLANLHTKSFEPIVIDKMYVDTTFLNDTYVVFPKRSDSVRCAVDEIGKWMESPDHWVALHPSARFGYEYVFNEISRKLNMKVYIGDDDWGLYSAYEKEVPGVTNILSNTKIHKCRNRSEHNQHHHCLSMDIDNKKFLFVHLSAMKWTNYQLESKTVERRDNRLDVCFPTHCSKTEIINFVSYFAPKSVVGFPNEFKMADAEKAFDVTFKPCKRKRGSDFKKRTKILK